MNPLSERDGRRRRGLFCASCLTLSTAHPARYCPSLGVISFLINLSGALTGEGTYAYRVTSTYPNGTHPTVGPRSWACIRPSYGCGGIACSPWHPSPVVVRRWCAAASLYVMRYLCHLISLGIPSRVPLLERLTLEGYLAMTHIDASTDQS